VPVLRLPFPADPAASSEIPGGFATAVVLPLRDGAALALVEALLRALDDALLLALPALGRLEVDAPGLALRLDARDDAGDVVVTDGDRETRWARVERRGSHPGDLLAGRPLEERDRPGWQVSVAVPVDGRGAPQPLPATFARVVHAPTPTDDATSLPVLVTGTFPLDPSRRRIAPGPVTGALVQEVGACYATLAARLAASGDPRVLDLVPAAWPAGERDGELVAAVQAALRRCPLLPAADAAAGALRPDEAVVLAGADGAHRPAALAAAVAGLVAPPWWRPEPLRRLGVRLLSLADVVDELAGWSAPPSAWRDLYAALDGADPDALRGLPVPLADGRIVRGPRDVLLPAGDPLPDLAGFGVRACHPDAAHPLLARLGAVVATAPAVLALPAVRAAVAADDDGQLTPALLALVRHAGDELPGWLADVRLVDDLGGHTRAGDLYLPGAAVTAWLDDPPVPAGDLAPDLLLRLGVATTLPVLVDADVALDEQCWHDLPDEDAWVEVVLAGLPDQPVPPVVAELLAVRDLDLVRQDAWPAVLSALAGDPALRRCVVEPAWLTLADGSRRAAVPYTAWWLAQHVRVAGTLLADACAPDAQAPVRALCRPLPDALRLDGALIAALGLPRTLDDLADPPDRLLALLADPGRGLPAADLLECYAVLAATPGGRRCDPPPALRVPSGPGSRVVPAEQVRLVTAPHLVPFAGPAPLPGTDRLATLLGVAPAEHPADPAGGAMAPVPPAVREVLPGAPATYRSHDELVVGGRELDWWIDRDGTVRASTVAGLARALAWAAGAWPARSLVAEVLTDPAALPDLLAELWFDA
jgi:hypothetical protein